MDIPEPVLTRLLSVFGKNHSIDKVYLYGSRARGDNRPNSDIDLALLGDDIQLSTITDIQEAAGLYKVDVVNLSEELDGSFSEELDKDVVLIYERESSAALPVK